MEKKKFLITIDTEGDNLWSSPKKPTTKNAEFLFRFQALCEKFGFKPTYLTNYEMANSSVFQELGHDVIKRNTGEIGMHIHAWDMPPAFDLTKDDSLHKPYLIEYPENMLREKVSIMTDLLENTFQKKMVSHRAGRWSFNEQYAQILIEHGYKVDCSVTPLVSWEKSQGDPNKNGGTNYTDFPSGEYFLSLADISKAGESDLLELPMSICHLYPTADFLRKKFDKVMPVRKLLNYFYPSITWLRPDGTNLKHMCKLLDTIKNSDENYAMFMLHSSEFMPGGSPTFDTKESIEKLYSDLDTLFSKASEHFKGVTTAEYRDFYCEQRTKNK